ncbi:alpha/beta fold hydrolase [Hoeflea halophila]|nr:alpha/beta fold hydrolase [Hoeflea halophila]
MMTRLVCLPGLLCTAEVFADVLPGVYAPADVVNLPDSNDFHTIASDIAAALPDRAILVGMSMGSYLCLEIARHQPQRVAGLVLIGCTAKADSEDAAAMRGKVVKWARREGLDALSDTICAGMLAPANRGKARLRQKVAQMAHAQGLEIFARHQAALAGRPDNSAALAEITCPALVMTGAEDTVTPPHAGLAVAEGLAHGRFMEIENAGHLAVLEQPGFVAAQLNAFMGQDMKKETQAE